MVTGLPKFIGSTDYQIFYVGASGLEFRYKSSGCLNVIVVRTIVKLIFGACPVRFLSIEQRCLERV